MGVLERFLICSELFGKIPIYGTLKRFSWWGHSVSVKNIFVHIIQNIITNLIYFIQNKQLKGEY